MEVLGGKMKKVLYFLKGYKKEAIFGPLFKLIEACFELIVPFVIAAIVDKGLPGGEAGYILKMGAVLIALGLAGLASSVTAQYFAAKAAVGTASKLRKAVFEHIQKLSYTDLDKIGTATLITRMTSDINQVQSGINMALRLFLRSPFIVFGAMIMAFTIDARCALIFAIVIPILAIIVYGVMLITMPMYKRSQERLDEVLLATRENLTGVRVLRAFNREGDEITSFEKKHALLTNLQKRAGSISALTNPLTYIAINIALILLIRSGALRVESGILTQGQVVALVNYIGQILVELIKLANLIITVTKAAACGNRVESVLTLRPGMKDMPKTGEVIESGSVEFEHVSLCYSGSSDNALTDISFRARDGEMIGVIGGTGCGKTSLVNLIPRFYDATEGRVIVDGTDVREFNTEDLRARIAVVPQKATLFKGTIRSNLLWGDPKASEETIREAITVAQADDVVTAKGGLDADIEQLGRNLSGGQRQRLTIARALVRRPKILILDDSASALDYATDARLRAALRQLPYQPTVFVVSQRASSVRYCDRILVIDDGQLVGIGTHEYLLNDCKVYREIYDSQFRKEAH